LLTTDTLFYHSKPSRVSADFSIEVFDWNQIEQAKSLGSAMIDLTELEPFQGVERSLQLVSTKFGQKGVVRVRFLFQTEVIAKSRKHTSTFSGATRTMTTLSTAPLGAGKVVLHDVAGVSKKHKDEESLPPVPGLPAGQASRSIPPPDDVMIDGPTSPATAASFAAENGNGNSGEPGILKVTVLDAKDVMTSDGKAYVVIRVGGSESRTKHSVKTMTPEWCGCMNLTEGVELTKQFTFRNEAFSFTAGPMTPKIYVWVYDHKTLAKDKLLGEGEVDVSIPCCKLIENNDRVLFSYIQIWRHLQIGTTSSAEVSVELQEHGLLHLRLDFNVDANPMGRGSSSISVNRSMTVSSPSRFSVRGRRPTVAASDHDG
jgi:C2 domain